MERVPHCGRGEAREIITLDITCSRPLTGHITPGPQSSLLRTNRGPPPREPIRSLFAEALEKYPDVKVRMGTLDDIADAILAEKPELVVVRGETPDTWIHGCMSDPGGMRHARNVRPLIPAVEVLHTQLRQWGLPIEDHDEEVAKAFEQS